MKKTTRKQLRTIRRRRLALALAGALAMPAAPVLAQTACSDCLPQNGQVVYGTATSNYTSGGVIRPNTDANDNTMTITQTTNGAIIDWGSFGISAGYDVQFVVPNSSSVTLNRVVGFLGPGYGVNASVIGGGLTSNGNVFLINPAGITFGNGAVVNVGGLVASTLWMNSGDFINGLSTGQYHFNGFNGDPATTHQVRNNGSITAGAGGVAFVGSTLYNRGDILTNGGNIGFGAGTQVTVDFDGDGLTQVTLDAVPTVNSGIVQDRFGTMTADGGQILLRSAMAGTTGGGIAISGLLRAQTVGTAAGHIEITSNGAVILGAPGIYSDASSPYTPGTIDVTGQAGENGGSVLIQGNSFLMVNDDNTLLNPADPLSQGSTIDAHGGANGGQVDIQTAGGMIVTPLSLISADGTTGTGGQIRLTGNTSVWVLGSEITAGSKVGNGGSIGLQSVAGDILLGSLATHPAQLYAGGGGNGGTIGLFAPNGLLFSNGFISTDGGINGGQVIGVADQVVMTETSEVHADGGSGNGGQVGLRGTTQFAGYGQLTAHGNAAGGSVVTATSGSFDVRGLRVDAGATGTAGTWTMSAPVLNVVNGSATGTSTTSVFGTDLQDAEINNAFANGTSVVLQSAGNVGFDNAQIQSTSTAALALTVNAEGSIFGNDFSITSLYGPLDMAFNADSAGTLPSGGGIDFQDGTLASNGGDILMYGQSDPVAGRASGADDGVALRGMDVSTNGGDLLLRGNSTGFRGSPDNAGVFLANTTIDTGAGGVTIDGTGTGVASGVRVEGGSIDAGLGGIDIHGLASGTGDGVWMNQAGLAAAGGDIGITGTGGDQGVYLGGAAGLYSGGGDIVVHGEGGSGDGSYLSGQIQSDGGLISLYGSSTDAIGLQFQSGFFNGIDSAGGDIDITGTGATGGVALVGSGYGGNTIDSGGGLITIVGTASAANAVGTLVSGLQIVGGSGDVGITGTSAAGIGLQFADGAGVATTTGAIGLYGTGANFGLDIADGALDTDSGDITLVGDATATTAVAGVRVTGDGLTTDGGDITVRGTSAGGVGVQLGDGSDPFAVGSSGGAILIEGTGVSAGVQMQGNQVNSGGGAVTITGDASGADATGVDLTGVTVDSGAGDIRIEGTAVAGTGVLFAGGGSLTTTSGDITVIGTGLHGLDASDVPFSTDTGGIHLEGHAQQGTGLSLGSGGLTTNGGDVTLIGETASDGQGVQIGGNIASNGGAIRISGTSGSPDDFNHGVFIQGGTSIDSGGGDIDIAGDTAGGIGIWVDGVAIASHGGDVGLDGSSTGSTPYTHGVALSRGAGIDSAGGDIRITGTSPGSGVLMFGDVALTSSTGDIVIQGTSSLDGGLNDGIRIFDYNGGTTITSTSGNISLTGTASGAGSFGVDLGATTLSSGAGNISVTGAAAAGTGLAFHDDSAITTSTGDIQLIGTGASSGMFLDGGEVSTTSGHLDLRGRATAQGALGLRIGAGAHIATQGGGIELSGEGNGAAGLSTDAGSSIDAGNSLVVLRAASGGNADAIVLGGTVHSGVGVDLRPGGVGAAGDVYERAADQITLGTGTGFALSAAELARIDAPELVIGSNLHAGAIRVLEAVARNGNLTLQNQGGSGGIDLQAGLDVGDHTLVLASGGSITQASAAALHAHSLLAIASGDVLLGNAQNDVASTTLAGSAGGDFEFLDANTLAVGSVSGVGFNADAGNLASMGATGIQAGGDALIRNLAGDMTLNAGVTATNIDLVTAGRLQNVAGASLVASGDWRVWANTWEGETRGGLAGSGNLPNLYGCLFQGACGVTVPGTDNHFIYVQQPTALITFGNATREYGLPNPAFSYTVTGAILGDTAANVATGSASTTATIGSDVGQYAITGTFASAAGYRIQLVPGTLAITPATLLFTADSFVRYLGTPNPAFSGTVTGFRNGDTVQSVFGSTVIWNSPAGMLSPIGYYPIIGGAATKNYVFAQAPGNATALQIVPLPQLSDTPVNFVRETVDTYVYDRNFGAAPVCALNASLEDQKLAGSGDPLSSEWSKVRSRPNLTNCFDSERENGCGNF